MGQMGERESAFTLSRAGLLLFSKAGLHKPEAPLILPSPSPRLHRTPQSLISHTRSSPATNASTTGSAMRFSVIHGLLAGLLVEPSRCGQRQSSGRARGPRGRQRGGRSWRASSCRRRADTYRSPAPGKRPCRNHCLTPRSACRSSTARAALTQAAAR